MNAQNAVDRWSEHSRAIDESLQAILDRTPTPDNLREAAAYAVLGPGKRMRPILAILCAEAAGGNRDAAMPAACALELVHAFSLVHDDLPAMDDDDIRRGRPSLHVRSGEAMAVLTGDLLLTLAFETLAREPSADSILGELAEATRSMIAGQVYDTLGGFPADAGDAERLDRIHQNKTGALIRAACRMGGMAAGADAAILAGLTRYGEAVGLMFQIVDDLLDVTQSTEHLGKTSGKDRSAGKQTWPTVHGIDRTRERIEDLRREALEALAPLGPAADEVRWLAEFLAVRTR